jgi:hypothetical protein
MGKFKKAVDNQQNAIEIAKKEKAPADQLKKLNATLIKYKARQSKNS